MEKVASADGTTLALDVCGSGPPLVIVGGSFHDRRVAPDLTDLLAERFTVVRYDRRGRGSSTGDTVDSAGDDPAESVRREIADLRAVVASVNGTANGTVNGSVDGPADGAADGAGTTPVYGPTTGGLLALRAAAAGAPVGPVIVFEPPFRAAGAPRPPRQFLPTLQHLVRSRRNDAAAAYYLTAAMCLGPAAVDGLRHAPVWTRLEELAPSLLADAAVLGDHRAPTAVLRRVRVPVLALAGRASPPWCAEAARATAAAVPAGRHALLDGPPHDAHPAALARAVTDFVAAG